MWVEEFHLHGEAQGLGGGYIATHQTHHAALKKTVSIKPQVYTCTNPNHPHGWLDISLTSETYTRQRRRGAWVETTGRSHQCRVLGVDHGAEGVLEHLDAVVQQPLALAAIELVRVRALGAVDVQHAAIHLQWVVWIMCEISCVCEDTQCLALGFVSVGVQATRLTLQHLT